MPSCLPLCVCHQGTISTFSSPHFISLQGSFYTKLIWSLLLLEYYHHFPLCQISHYSPFLHLYRSNITCDLNQTYKRQLNINLEDLSMAFSFILVTIIPRTFFKLHCLSFVSTHSCFHTDSSHFCVLKSSFHLPAPADLLHFSSMWKYGKEFYTTACCLTCFFLLFIVAMTTSHLVGRQMYSKSLMGRKHQIEHKMRAHTSAQNRQL